MTVRPKKLAILGATGSIGCSTLEVVQHSRGALEVAALTAHTRLDEAVEQAKAFRPRWFIATDPKTAAAFDFAELPAETELLIGAEKIAPIVAHESIDVVVAAIVGSAGLEGAWAALEAGKTLAIANKEPLVMAGPLVTELAARRGAKLLPVDSEHSAIFQALASGRREEVRRLVLTASGGPFRQHTKEQLTKVTVTEALAHPTWDMGAKITIDSATMMNKALEIIEARWLFDIPAEQISVVVHPQSIVHSLVEFVDGSVIAQMSPPDMRLPIQYALTWPDRCDSPAEKLDLTTAMCLEFEPPDEDRFPALRLGREVAQRGGTAGAVLNAANEAAVAAFLEQRIRFIDIAPACEAVLNQHNYEPRPTLEQLLKLDRWAREEMLQWAGA
jgi:1-deoxy-D-xylulose-5-phosphate reductoisomerase